MTMTVAECLAATEVVFWLDTNILVEFRSPTDLPWKELAPNATLIHLRADQGRHGDGSA